MDSRYGGAGGTRRGRRGGSAGRGERKYMLCSPDGIPKPLFFYRKNLKSHLDEQENTVVGHPQMPTESQSFAPRRKRGGIGRGSGRGRWRGRGRGRGRGGGKESAGVDLSNRGNIPYATDRQNEWDEDDGMSQGSYGSMPSLVSDEVSTTDAEAAKALINLERNQWQRQRERKQQEQILNSQPTVNSENYPNSEDSEQESVDADEDDDEGSDGSEEEACMDGAGQKPPGSSGRSRGQRGRKNRNEGRVNGQWRPKAEEIYLHILKRYQGRILTEWQLEEAIDIFPDFLAVIRRFEASMFNVFKVQGQVRFVTVFHKEVRLCLKDRNPEGCGKDNCPFFHVCRDFIMGSCRFGDRCKYSHRAGGQGNAGMLMAGLGEAELQTLLFCSAPRLCLNYNNSSGCPDFACPDLHLCRQQCLQRCSKGDACVKTHTLKDSEHNSWVLKSMHITKTTESKILRVMLVPREPAPTGTRLPPSLRPPRPGPTPQDAEKTSVDIFRYLLRTCRGRVITPSQFAAAQAKFPDFLSIVRRYETSKFRVYKNNGEVVCVTAYHKDARACYDYNTKPSRNRRDPAGCQKEDCPFFHICKDFILGNCQFLSPRPCVFSHNLKGSSCQEVCRKLGLDVLEEEELRTLLGCSRPRVCWAYSHGQGCLLPHCPDLHFCWNHFHRKCMLGSACPLSHTWQDEGHNAWVLDLHRMKNFKDGLIFKSVLMGSAQDVLPVEPAAAVPAISPSPSMEEATSTGTARSDVICEKFVWSTCGGGTSCTGSHGNQRLPYAWQVQVKGRWVDAVPEWNVRLEKDFCNFKTEVHGIQIVGESAEASASLEDMTALLGSKAYAMRRKSTPSFVEKKEDVPVNFYTRWQWRFDGECGGPQLYEPDKLQATLEDKYVKGQKTYHFQRDKFFYRLDFEEMTQGNLETGKKRTVLRRPVFVSQEDVLFGVRPNSPLHGAVPPVSGLAVPPHWSPLDRWQVMERVRLESSSAEYQEVSSHFYTTLKDKREIKSIHRVQNPALWDQLQSQQRIMEDQLRREGRSDPVRVERLFHGTDSLDVVRRICVQNFDHRLSGKNATVYGQGAYFARDASYSDGYTKGDPRYMFRAHVLVGDFTVGTSDMKRPPNRSGDELYDSCVNNVSAPTIFVVFKMSQYYPEYLIEYVDKSKPEPPQYSSIPHSHTSSSLHSTGTDFASSAAVDFSSSGRIARSSYRMGRLTRVPVTNVTSSPSTKQYSAPAVPVSSAASSPSSHSSSMYSVHRPPTPYDMSGSSSSMQKQSTAAATTQPNVGSAQTAAPLRPRTQRLSQHHTDRDRLRSTSGATSASSGYSRYSHSSFSPAISPTSHTPTPSFTRMPSAGSVLRGSGSQPAKSKKTSCVVM